MVKRRVDMGSSPLGWAGCAISDTIGPRSANLNGCAAERTPRMKLGCICGCFNRAFDAGHMDQFRFLEHCARQLRVTGAELQDIHFPETRAPYRQRLRRTAGDL